MPLITGAVATAVSQTGDPYQVTVTGSGFVDTQYPASSIGVSSDNTTWTEASSVTTWSDTSVSGSFASLPSGEYYVRVTTSDNANTTYSGTIVTGARLSRIAYDIEKAISQITTANGYAITWGSVNQPDMALQTYPSADITYNSEQAEDALNLGHFGFSTVEFIIRIRCKMTTTADVPTHYIDQMYDTALFSLRKRFRALMVSGAAMIGTESPIVYNRMERENEVSGDRFAPGSMLTYWTVRYFDRD